MRWSPLMVTGPVPALSRMVTGAFSSNSPKLTYGERKHRVLGWITMSDTICDALTIGRQPTCRLAMGTETVFPWWFMAVTSTTLFSSLAPSPRHTCRRVENVHSITNSCSTPLVERFCGQDRKYRSEFQEVLQVLLIIALESVKRNFGGQLTAWKTNVGRTHGVWRH